MIEHICKSVQNSNIARDPFPYIVAENFFPEHISKKIQKMVQQNTNSIPIHVPEVDMKVYPQKGIRRYQLIIKQENNNNSDFFEFMLNLKQNVFNKSVVDTIFDKFSKKKYNQKFEEVMLLVKHARGFYMNPHTDIDKKIFSCIYNIPLENSPDNIGTAIYHPKSAIEKSAQYQHYPRELFEVDHKISFVKNTCFIFFRTEQSYHGVEKLETDDPRFQLQFNLSNL